MVNAIIGNRHVFAFIPATLADVCKEKLDHFLVNECYTFEIKTPELLIEEFYKPRSLFLNSLESMNIAILSDLLVDWGVFSPTHCILLQNFPPSLN